MSMNGPNAAIDVRVSATEEHLKQLDFAVGKLASFGADVERLANAVGEYRAEMKGELARQRCLLNGVAEKLGVVATTAAAADAKADLADAKASRASLTNETSSGTASVAAPADDETPTEKAAATLAGRLTVSALRGGLSWRVVLIALAALLGGGAAGSRIQSCAQPSAPSAPAK